MREDLKNINRGDTVNNYHRLSDLNVIEKHWFSYAKYITTSVY